MKVEVAKNNIGSPVHFNAGDAKYNGFIGSVDEEKGEISIVLVDGSHMNSISASLIMPEHDTDFEQVK